MSLRSHFIPIFLCTFIESTTATAFARVIGRLQCPEDVWRTNVKNVTIRMWEYDTWSEHDLINEEYSDEGGWFIIGGNHSETWGNNFFVEFIIPCVPAKLEHCPDLHQLATEKGCAPQCYIKYTTFVPMEKRYFDARKIEYFVIGNFSITQRDHEYLSIDCRPIDNMPPIFDDYKVKDGVHEIPPT